MATARIAGALGEFDDFLNHVPILNTQGGLYQVGIIHRIVQGHMCQTPAVAIVTIHSPTNPTPSFHGQGYFVLVPHGHA